MFWYFFLLSECLPCFYEDYCPTLRLTGISFNHQCRLKHSLQASLYLSYVEGLNSASSCHKNTKSTNDDDDDGDDNDINNNNSNNNNESNNSKSNNCNNSTKSSSFVRKSTK